MFDVSRDNARTPMQWDDSEYAGFSNVEPWLRVNSNKDAINVKESLEDKNSIYHYYQKLIAFRKGNEVIKDGEYIDLDKMNKYLMIYKRKLGDKEVVVFSNFSKENRKSKLLQQYKDYKKVLSNYDNNDDVLLPYETRVLINY